jgi:hypothetical protein
MLTLPVVVIIVVVYLNHIIMWWVTDLASPSGITHAAAAAAVKAVPPMAKNQYSTIQPTLIHINHLNQYYYFSAQ